MTGGAGNDAYFVDNISDQMNENPGEGNDTVFSTVDFRLSANVENLILQGGADLQAYGNSAVNALFGNAGSNILDGGAGADAMIGGLLATTPISSTISATRRSRTPARATIRYSRPLTSGCRPTSTTSSCKAAPTCRPTATAG